MNKQSHKLLLKANQLKEEGNFLESLKINDQALFRYDLENDLMGFAECLANRSITLRVYANLHNSVQILILAKHDLTASIEIAKKIQIPEAMPILFYNLAQIEEDLSEFKNALIHYKTAIQGMLKNPKALYNRQSVIVNMKLHMLICEFKDGKKNSLEKAKKALEDLENSDESNKFNKDVWVSGGYLRLVEVLKSINKKEAKNYLLKARNIIKSNNDLILRKKQFNKLSQSF